MLPWALLGITITACSSPDKCLLELIARLLACALGGC
jgi:hypothetical protein